MNSTINLYLYDVLEAKFTTQELPSGMFISTAWYPFDCLEEDRTVTEFETYSAAIAHTYKTAFEFSLEYATGLKLDK